MTRRQIDEKLGLPYLHGRYLVTRVGDQILMSYRRGVVVGWPKDIATRPHCGEAPPHPASLARIRRYTICELHAIPLTARAVLVKTGSSIERTANGVGVGSTLAAFRAKLPPALLGSCQRKVLRSGICAIRPFGNVRTITRFSFSVGRLRQIELSGYGPCRPSDECQTAASSASSEIDIGAITCTPNPVSLTNNEGLVACSVQVKLHPKGSALRMIWDWGDGSTATTTSPTDAPAHFYQHRGTYTVKLTITAAGNTANATTAVRVET